MVILNALKNVVSVVELRLSCQFAYPEEAEPIDKGLSGHNPRLNVCSERRFGGFDGGLGVELGGGLVDLLFGVQESVDHIRGSVLQQGTRRGAGGV